MYWNDSIRISNDDAGNAANAADVADDGAMEWSEKPVDECRQLLLWQRWRRQSVCVSVTVSARQVSAHCSQESGRSLSRSQTR